MERRHNLSAQEQERQQRARRLVVQSMLMATGLCGLKIAAGLASQSLSLLASALDSLMDLFSSAVNYVSLSFSQQPADDDHLYGHGKIEAVAGCTQGIIIALSGAALLVESVRRLMTNATVEAGIFGIGVMLISMVLSAVHGARLKRAAQEAGSAILRAEGLHFSMDVLANLGVLLVLVMMRLGAPPFWDVVISIVVGGYVVKEALVLIRVSINQLLDRRLSDDTHAAIEKVIKTHHESISGFHDLRTRQAGDKIFIDFHVEISGVEKFKDAHDITESLIDKIREGMPNADVTVHSDPEGEF